MRTSPGYQKYERILPKEESIRSWNEKLISIIEKHRSHFHWYGDSTANVLRSGSPTNTLAYLAHTFFGCNIIVLAPDEDSGETCAEKTKG